MPGKTTSKQLNRSSHELTKQIPECDAHPLNLKEESDQTNGCKCCKAVLNKIEQLSEIVMTIGSLANRDQDWYSVRELADKVGRQEWTVRDWCWRGRINADKALHGRGVDREYRISHDEYLRYRREGLLPGRPRD